MTEARRHDGQLADQPLPEWGGLGTIDYAVAAGDLDMLGARGLDPEETADDRERRDRQALERASAEDPPELAGPSAPLTSTTAGRLRGLMGEGPSWRTLAEIDDAPPGPLLFGMLEAGENLLYAGPGVGKGSTVAYLLGEAQAAGMLPMVHDAEMRGREYARRVSGLGGDRSRVVYPTPRDLGAKLAGQPLWEQRDALHAVVKDAGVDIMFIDSILPAVGIGEERLRSDAQAPFLYVAALDSLGIPTVSLGHPPKGQPEGDPFGSMAWLAAMRLTWLGTRAEGDAHRVRWRPKKRNERGHIDAFLLTFEYDDDGRLASVTREDDDKSHRERLLSVLSAGPATLREVAERIAEEFEELLSDADMDRLLATIRQAAHRARRDGLVDYSGKTRDPKGATWSLTRPS
jgi:YD repeat-containing protein